MLEDQRLLKSLRNGDRDALRRIYEKYKDRLLTVAGCMSADMALAEDCLHDVFVTLAGEAAVLRIKRSLKSYLTVCVANRVRDYWRKKARKDVSLADHEDWSVAADDPSAPLVADELSEQIMTALGTLSFEQREVITLHLQGGMTFKEIARQQGVSINTAQSRYRYGIDKLKKIMEGNEPLSNSA